MKDFGTFEDDAIGSVVPHPSGRLWRWVHEMIFRESGLLAVVLSTSLFAHQCFLRTAAFTTRLKPNAKEYVCSCTASTHNIYLSPAPVTLFDHGTPPQDTPVVTLDARCRLLVHAPLVDFHAFESTTKQFQFWAGVMYWING